jgi:mxaL protein
MRASALAAGAFDKHSRAITLALALLLLAWAMPTFNRSRATYDYLVVFDITQSMNVADYMLGEAPASRLAYAREATRRALRDLPCGSRVGWGAFAEYRTVLLLAPIEVCAHYSDLLASLDRIDGRMRWGEASEVWKGVLWAIRAAKETRGAPNVIFLSDGHEAPPLGAGAHPLFDDVKPGDVRGWLIGVGGYTPQPIPRTDDEGKLIGYWRAEDVMQTDASDDGGPSREHMSALRERHLRALAKEVGFEYARLAGPASLSDAMRDPRFARPRSVPIDLYWLPVAAALMLLALRFRPDLRMRGRGGSHRRITMSAAQGVPVSNKQTYWFPAKRYGWGWGPPRVWQGWAVLAAFIGLFAAGFWMFPPKSELVPFLAYAVFLTAVLIAICWIKGEPPRWRWGGHEEGPDS